MFSATYIWENTYLSHLAYLFHHWNKSKLFCSESLSPKSSPEGPASIPASSFMSNRLLQALSLIGRLLQPLLLIGRMTECHRVAQVQRITLLIRANYKQVCQQQRRQERWLSGKEASCFWGRGVVTWLNTRGGVSWSELTRFNKFCSFQFYKARLGGRQFNYNCNSCFHPNEVRGRFKVAEPHWVTQLLLQLNIMFEELKAINHSCQLIKSAAF